MPIKLKNGYVRNVDLNIQKIILYLILIGLKKARKKDQSQFRDFGKLFLGFTQKIKKHIGSSVIVVAKFYHSLHLVSIQVLALWKGKWNVGPAKEL